MCVCVTICGVAPLTAFQALLAPSAAQMLSRISALAASVGSRRRTGSANPVFSPRTPGPAVLGPMYCVGMGVSTGRRGSLVS